MKFLKNILFSAIIFYGFNPLFSMSDHSIVKCIKLQVNDLIESIKETREEKLQNDLSFFYDAWNLWGMCENNLNVLSNTKDIIIDYHNFDCKKKPTLNVVVLAFLESLKKTGYQLKKIYAISSHKQTAAGIIKTFLGCTCCLVTVEINHTEYLICGVIGLEKIKFIDLEMSSKNIFKAFCAHYLKRCCCCCCDKKH
jgi:hypothetical protein